MVEADHRIGGHYRPPATVSAFPEPETPTTTPSKPTGPPPVLSTSSVELLTVMTPLPLRVPAPCMTSGVDKVPALARASVLVNPAGADTVRLLMLMHPLRALLSTVVASIVTVLLAALVM